MGGTRVSDPPPEGKLHPKQEHPPSTPELNVHSAKPLKLGTSVQLLESSYVARAGTSGHPMLADRINEQWRRSVSRSARLPGNSLQLNVTSRSPVWAAGPGWGSPSARPRTAGSSRLPAPSPGLQPPRAARTRTPPPGGHGRRSLWPRGCGGRLLPVNAEARRSGPLGERPGRGPRDLRPGRLPLGRSRPPSPAVHARSLARSGK